MKQFLLKISGSQVGPYSEEDITQMYHDNRIDRNTPCRPPTDEVWKTLDDYLPFLKYDLQLPPSPAKPPPVYIQSVTPPPAQKVAVVDVDVPFFSIFRLMLK